MHCKAGRKPKRAVDRDETITLAEAKMIRHGLKQANEGKTRPWSRIKNELGL